MKKREKGVILVEIVVGSAIIASVFVVILSLYLSLGKISSHVTPRVQAQMLAEEGVEAVKTLRDSSYSSNIGSLSSNATYYLSWSDVLSNFYLSTTPFLIDDVFTRTITIENVYRDTNSDLASSGTNDPGTKLVTISVNWLEGGATTTYSIQSYILDTFTN